MPRRLPGEMGLAAAAAAEDSHPLHSPRPSPRGCTPDGRAINFLPLYQQTVQGSSATDSGLLLLPMMGAAMVVSLFVGQSITRSGRYKTFPVAGGAVGPLGIAC